MEEKAGLIIFAKLSITSFEVYGALIVTDSFLLLSHALFPIVSVKKVETPSSHCFLDSKGRFKLCGLFKYSVKAIRFKYLF